MISFAVQDVARRHGVRTAYQLMQRLGVPSATAYRIWNLDEKELISKATIERICVAFGCQPGDLIKLEAGRAQKGAAKRPRPKSKK